MPAHYEISLPKDDNFYAMINDHGDRYFVTYFIPFRKPMQRTYSIKEYGSNTKKIEQLVLEVLQACKELMCG